MGQKIPIKVELSPINNSGISINLINMKNKLVAVYLGIDKPFDLFIFDENHNRINPTRTIARKVPRDFKKPISAVSVLLQPNQNHQLKLLNIDYVNKKFMTSWTKGLYYHEYGLLPGTYRFRIISDLYIEESSELSKDIEFKKDQLFSIESNEVELILKEGIKMDFIEFNKKVHSIKEGMNKNEVLALLGNPHKKENNLWDYDYTDGPAPEPGQHLCYGVGIIFKNDIVIEINKAMADMM
jgi:hypothetical protein